MGQFLKVKILVGVLPIFFLAACFKESVQEKSNSYVLSDALKHENVVPVAIVGSGPAGLSAALYIARAGMKPFVFAGPRIRGQLTETTVVENWPGRAKVLGTDLMEDIEKQAVSFGAVIIHDSILQVDFSSWPFAMKTEDGRSFKALTVILATGATPRKLKVPGESDFWGKGVTSCAVCDASYFKGKDVVIAGGGDSAAEMVFELLPYVKKVTILVRKEMMRAAIATQKKILADPRVSIEYNKEIAAVYGQNEHVTGIDVYDNKLKTKQRRPIDGVFLAIGHDPNNKILTSGIQLDNHGYLVMVGRSQHTSVPGVFAAGEIQDPTYRQAIIAAGEGARAGIDASSFLYKLGFTAEVEEKLERNLFENFSDVSIEIKEISQNKELYDRVLRAKGLVLLDFYTTTCPCCIQMLPILAIVGHKLGNKVTILKVNQQTAYNTIFKELWFKHNIQVRHLPTVLVFKDGVLVDKITKMMKKPELYEYLQKFL